MEIQVKTFSLALICAVAIVGSWFALEHAMTRSAPQEDAAQRSYLDLQETRALDRAMIPSGPFEIENYAG